MNKHCTNIFSQFNRVVLVDSIKMYILIILLILKVDAMINPYGPTVVSDYTKCVHNVINISFKKAGLLIFAHTDNASPSVAKMRENLLKTINGSGNYSVEVQNPGHELPICDNKDEDEDLGVVNKDQFDPIPIANYYIIVLDSYIDFTRVAGRLIRLNSWNPQAKFLILLFNLVDIDKTNIRFAEKILTCLFRYNVINIVVIAPQANHIRNANIYSWRPYDPPQFCGYYNETARNRVLVEDICERGETKYKTDVFKDRIPDSMEGCVLYILALQRQPYISKDEEDPNIEKIYVNEIAKIYNLKTNYEITNDYRGEKDCNGTWTGAFKELASKKGHIVLGGIFPDNDVHEDFECSRQYLADSYTWVVPRAFPSPPWVALIIIFQDLVWYCVIACFFICVISWNILGHLSGDIYYKGFVHCFLNTWISMLGFCSYARPIREGLRVFYVFFNLYCILFLTAYQTKLFDVLTNPSFEEQIDTIEELVESDLKYGGFEELHDLFYNSSDPFDYFLGENWIDVQNISQALIDVAVNRNFSLLCSRLELAHLSATMPELSDSSGNYKYFVFERNMFTVSMEMVALKGFPFIDKFSHTLRIFSQIGINTEVRHYFKELNARRRARLVRSLKKESSNGNSLSLDHLQGGFLALLLGFTSGFLAFITEFIMSSGFVKLKFLHFKRFILLMKRHSQNG